MLCAVVVFFLLHQRFQCQSNPIGSSIDSVKKPTFTLKPGNSILIALFAYETIKEFRKKPTTLLFFPWIGQMAIFIRQYNDWKMTKVMEFYELFFFKWMSHCCLRFHRTSDHNWKLPQVEGGVQRVRKRMNTICLCQLFCFCEIQEKKVGKKSKRKWDRVLVNWWFPWKFIVTFYKMHFKL